MPWVWVLVVVVGAMASAVICRAVMASGLRDAPTDRKTHAAPTPTAGGLAIGGGFASALVVASLPGLRGWADVLEPDAVGRAGALALLAFAALALGFLDDLRPWRAAPKFGLLAALSLAAAVFWARADALPLGLGVALELGLVLGVCGSALWVFTLVNATNFMDGANGLAMGSIAIGLSGLAAVSLAAGAPHAAILSLAGAGALSGFLIWNFPKGAVFAGDAGSLFAGALAALASLLAIQDGGVSPFVPAILFFPILGDSLLTLAHRVAMRRNIFNGHREHFYQIGLRSGMSHRRVTLIYWAAAAHCALVGFLAAFGDRISASWTPPGPEAGGLGVFAHFAASLAASAGPIALAVLAIVALRVSTAIRRFAKARGFDSEV